MVIVKNFGKRHGYGTNIHVAFIINAFYKRRAGANLDIFVESIVNHNGIQFISLRENGTNNYLNLDYINKYDLYEIIINEVNENYESSFKIY